MSSPASSSNNIPDEIKEIFSTLISGVAADASKLAKADVIAAGQSIKANPTATNLGAQVLLLQAKAVLAEPVLESDGIAGLGTALESLGNLIPG